MEKFNKDCADSPKLFGYLPYQIGDSVMHLSSGACRVTGTVTRMLEGCERLYLELVPYTEEHTKIFVPATEKGAQRLLPLMDTAQVQQLETAAQGSPVHWIEKAQDRREAYSQAFRSADLLRIAGLTKMLAEREKEHPLSYTDRSFLDQARKYTISELAAVEETTFEQKLEQVVNAQDKTTG